MTNRTRLMPSGESDASLSPTQRDGAPTTTRELLVKYLDYVLPEVAALNPTSAMLLDQAITRLMETPSGGEATAPHNKLS